MGALIIDIYTILWKHFQRQSSKDEEFLASGMCGFCIVAALANVAQIAAFALGANPEALVTLSKGGQWIAGIGTLILCVAGMKIFIRYHPDLQSEKAITSRYAGLSRKRRVCIGVFIFSDFAILFIVRAIILAKYRGWS